MSGARRGLGDLPLGASPLGARRGLPEVPEVPEVTEVVGTMRLVVGTARGFRTPLPLGARFFPPEDLAPGFPPLTRLLLRGLLIPLAGLRGLRGFFLPLPGLRGRFGCRRKE